jgi:hypothetical protein
VAILMPNLNGATKIRRACCLVIVLTVFVIEVTCSGKFSSSELPEYTLLDTTHDFASGPDPSMCLLLFADARGERYVVHTNDADTTQLQSGPSKWSLVRMGEKYRLKLERMVSLPKIDWILNQDGTFYMGGSISPTNSDTGILICKNGEWKTALYKCNQIRGYYYCEQCLAPSSK